MATSTRIVSYEEWIHAPEVQDAIEEVVNGEIRIMPPNKSAHARVVHRLSVLLTRQLDESTTEIFESTFGLVIRRQPLTCRVPDLALFRKAGMVEIDGFFHSAPELAIEVLSPANDRRERAAKLADYESIGIPEVWLVSPEARTVEVLELQDHGRLTTAALVNRGVLTPRLFPEVTVEVAAMFP